MNQTKKNHFVEAIIIAIIITIKIAIIIAIIITTIITIKIAIIIAIIIAIVTTYTWMQANNSKAHKIPPWNNFPSTKDTTRRIPL